MALLRVKVELVLVVKVKLLLAAVEAVLLVVVGPMRPARSKPVPPVGVRLTAAEMVSSVVTPVQMTRDLRGLPARSVQPGPAAAGTLIT